MTEAEYQHPLRPFLKNWLWEHGRIGTRYLDCATGELKFDQGKKAGFAADRLIHVSMIRNETVISQVEPTNQDPTLARFLRAAQLGDAAEAGLPAQIQHAVQQCIEIGLRCTYQADAHRATAHFAEEAMFDDEIRAAVFAEIRKKYLPLREQMALYDFIVFHGLPAPLLICEAPLIDWRVSGKPAKPFITMVLAPYAILVGAPSAKTSRAAPVVWTKASAMGLFKDHNQLLVNQAKQWLVATSDAELEVLQSRFAPPAASATP